jgi:PTH1 family peptidyl-tRNA hydrolase
MILLVGLGNPGEKYARHRHNVGFMAVDAIGDAHGFSPAREKFQAQIREGFLNGPSGREKALILKPMTYMNDSGQSVGEAARFYRIDPEDVVVFYDELDLAAGKIRVKTGGGAAGHNGIRSIDSHLGNAFRRVRIGIGHPGDKSKVTNHVLGNFSKDDQEWLTPMLDAIASAAPFLTGDDDNRFASAVAQKLAPSKERQSTKVEEPPATSAAENKKSPESTEGPFSALKKLFKGERS